MMMIVVDDCCEMRNMCTTYLVLFSSSQNQKGKSNNFILNPLFQWTDLFEFIGSYHCIYEL